MKRLLFHDGEKYLNLSNAKAKCLWDHAKFKNLDILG